jgi:peroxiredoxin Q/BCP
MSVEIGDRAPAFRLPADDGSTVALKDFTGRGLVIYFYPKAFTPGCTGETCDFRDRHGAFTHAGYDIVGISPDPVGKLTAFRAANDVPFRLLSDEDHSVAEAYGAWGIKKNYGREYEGLIRSTVVVGPDGKVEHAWHNVRAKGHAARVERDVISGT